MVTCSLKSICLEDPCKLQNQLNCRNFKLKIEERVKCWLYNWVIRFQQIVHENNMHL